jgi:HK97 family phage portal protein
MGIILNTLQKGINSIYALRRTQEPRHPNDRRIPYTGRTQAGVFITPDRALMNDTVWACHKYVTEACGQLPARVIRKLPNGKQESVSNHPVDNVLNWRVNPNMSPFQFRETMVGWAIIHGNAVAEIERNGFGSVVNLWPIDPHRVSFTRDIDTGELVYKISQGIGLESVELSSNDVFHLRAFGNGDVGLSVIEYAAQTIGWARATELFGASFFGEGLNFSGTLVSDTKLDKDSAARIREELNQTYRGPERSNKIFIADQGLKFTRTSATPNDSQFIETLMFQVETICRFFAVPPHKVGHLIRMTFNNVEQLSIDAVGQCIVPWALKLEQEATYKLFGGNRNNLEVVFEVKGLLRGDFKSRQEGLQIQRRNGIINSGDWARLEDMPEPKDGKDTYIVEKNMVTMDQLINLPTPQAPVNTQTNDPQPAQNDNNAAQALNILLENEDLLLEKISA